MRSIFVLFGVLFSFAAFADVRLPGFFSDNMVFQRDKSIPVWGWASANEKITATFDGEVKTTKADRTGKWQVSFSAKPAGGPFSLSVKGRNNIVLQNILVGDVWICSGQSNMEWNVLSSADPEKEIGSANFPQIRHVKIPNTASASPQNDVSAVKWQVCSPGSVGTFTAVGYFFARELNNKLKVPIGLINTSWGGTHVETWTSRNAFESSDEFRDMIAKLPVVSLDSIAAIRRKEAAQRLSNLKGAIGNQKDTALWRSAEYNSDAWPKMTLPSMWEDRGLDDIDGTIWFRKVIDVPASAAALPALLELGPIDDSDDSYVNGVLVGSVRSKYNLPRKYQIPAGVLVPGRNVIAVRVEDTGGAGGIYGDSAAMKLSAGTTTIPLNGEWSFTIETFETISAGVDPNSFPSLLFNAMVHPLKNYSIKGAIWYQGEANTGRAHQYQRAFPLMINDWRKHWGYEFPFLFVQLASFKAGDKNGPDGSSWAELREAQTKTLSVANTGMAVTTDIGESADIHPKNKQDVGKRLAAIALNKVYGEKMVSSGPVFNKLEIRGKEAVLSFDNVGGGLVAKDKYGFVKGFEIAGADKQYRYARAWIDGDKVVVANDSVAAPVAVRYAWSDDPNDANLYNKEGFPAVPFKTDNWKWITEGVKFR
jgi:sialate O-acetylesterase